MKNRQRNLRLSSWLMLALMIGSILSPTISLANTVESTISSEEQTGNTLQTLSSDPLLPEATSESSTASSEMETVETSDEAVEPVITYGAETIDENELELHEDQKNPQPSIKDQKIEQVEDRVHFSGKLFAGVEETEKTRSTTVVTSFELQRKASSGEWETVKEWPEQEVAIQEQNYSFETEVLLVEDEVTTFRYVIKYKMNIFDQEDQSLEEKNDQGYLLVEDEYSYNLDENAEKTQTEGTHKTAEELVEVNRVEEVSVFDQSIKKEQSIPEISPDNSVKSIYSDMGITPFGAETVETSSNGQTWKVRNVVGAGNKITFDFFWDSDPMSGYIVTSVTNLFVYMKASDGSYPSVGTPLPKPAGGYGKLNWTSVEIPGLTPGQRYEFQLHVTFYAENYGIWGEGVYPFQKIFDITVPAPPPPPKAPSISNLKATHRGENYALIDSTFSVEGGFLSADISVYSDAACTSEVGNKTPIALSVTQTQMLVENLTPHAVYYAKLSVKDVIGNETTQVIRFTTSQIAAYPTYTTADLHHRFYVDDYSGATSIQFFHRKVGTSSYIPTTSTATAEHGDGNLSRYITVGNLTGLSADTEYEWYSRVELSNGTIIETKVNKFRTLFAPKPSITNFTAEYRGENHASFSANFNGNGIVESSPISLFSDSACTIKIGDVTYTNLTGTSCNGFIQGLTQNSVYYAKLLVRNTDGGESTAVFRFTTSQIGAYPAYTTADLHHRFYVDDYSFATSVQFFYRKTGTSSYTTLTSSANPEHGDGNLSRYLSIGNLVGLSANTEYEWYSRVELSNGNVIETTPNKFRTNFQVLQEYFDLTGTSIKNEAIHVTGGSSYTPTPSSSFTHSSQAYIYKGWLKESEWDGNSATPMPALRTGTVDSLRTHGEKVYLIYDLDSNSLRLDEYPNKFDFGNQHRPESYNQIFNLDASKYASTEPTDGFKLRVRDDRATHPGWKLTSTFSQLVGVNNTSDQLVGAKISFGVELKEIQNPGTPGETAITPTPAIAPSFGAPVSGSTATLSADGTALPFLSASNTKGEGVWDVLIDFDSVKIFVPAGQGNTGEEYQGTIQWDLEDTP
ncbi:WxL domain-containing protein [Enterococcus sp. AZ163]|uniref:WxL domain-containing protein n=1 Tax=Enterococcus sp. AZ163 TaxID=2774638 RepID=UPI003D272C7E